MSSAVPAPSPRLFSGKRVLGILLLALAIGVAFFFFYGPTSNMNWDPSFYFAQLRSPLIDHDLSIAGEVTIPPGASLTYAPSGLAHSSWPVGAGILWSPFFLAAHAAVLLVSPAHANGTWLPYIAATAAGSAFYGILGLFLTYRICRRFASWNLSLLAAALCLFASPFFYYIFHQPFFAHTTGLAVSAALLLAYLKLDRDEIPFKYSGLVLGMLFGLNLLTRYLSIIAILFPLAFYLERLVRSIRAKDPSAIGRVLLQGVVFTVVGLLVLSPQFLYWFRVENHFIVAQEAKYYVDSLLPVNLLKILFGINRGILFWLPFACLGLVGFFFIKDRKVAWLSFLFILLLLVMVGYRKDWYGGGSFGARFFIEALPVLSIGFVSLLGLLGRRRWFWFAAIPLALLLVAHQAVLLFSEEQWYALHWLDYQKYRLGLPLGLHWQWDAFLRLLSQPALLLSPRPGELHLSLFNSLRLGHTGLKMLALPLTAVIMVPFLSAVLFFLAPRVNSKALLWLSAAVVLFMLAWAVLFFVVG